MENKVFVGFFIIDGQPDSVEVPLTGNGERDRAALAKAIRDRHPKAKDIIPNGTRFGTTSDTTGFIEATPGMVLRNLFSMDNVGNVDPLRSIGRVFFSGAPYDVQLNLLRAQGAVTVTLKPRVSGANHGSIRFSNQLNPQTLVDDLHRILSEVLGRDARELVLDIREKK